LPDFIQKFCKSVKKITLNIKYKTKKRDRHVVDPSHSDQARHALLGLMAKKGPGGTNQVRNHARWADGKKRVTPTIGLARATVCRTHLLPGSEEFMLDEIAGVPTFPIQPL